LDTIALGAPAWIVATPGNKLACERLWKKHPHTDHREKGAITHYTAADPEDRLRGLVNIIPVLETHHGVQDNYLSFPNGFLVEVIGLTLTDNVANALRELAFLLL
jgi:hypothetical protein